MTARQVGGLFVPMSVLLGALAWVRTSLPQDCMELCTVFAEKKEQGTNNIVITIRDNDYDYEGELWNYVII